jgi:hypothetical protein
MTDGSNVHLTMSGFTATGSRYAKFMGTKGEIIADMSTNIIKLTRFGEDTVEIDVSKIASDFSGHGGGDNRMVSEFLDLLIYDKEPTSAITSVEHSVESHYCALAAEESRLNGGKLIDLDTFRK